MLREVERSVLKLLLLSGILFGAVAHAAGPLTADEVRELRAKIRMTRFISDPLPELNPESFGRFAPEPDTIAERVTYGSQYGMRIPSVLYIPKNRTGKAPAIIVVNGHGGDKYSWYAFYTGLLYARAGAVVLTYDPVGEGERHIQKRSGTRAHDTWQAPEEMARRTPGLLVTDFLQAVRYLKTRPEVDPDRIAAVGYSLGSYILGEGCALDSGVRSCVLVGGGNLDGNGEYWDRAKPMCVGLPYQSLRFLGDRAAVLYALHAHRGATLIYNGRGDEVVNMPATQDSFFQDLRARTAKLVANGTPIFDWAFDKETTASHRPWFVTRPVAEWLEKQLDFPNWDSDAIRRMPETHIGRWSDERQVSMDLFYLTEEREAGTMALGAGIPGLPRHRLDVVPGGDWELAKGLYVYEGWIRHARRDLAAESKNRRGAKQVSDNK
jgi:dienelactone hydrolase